MFDRDKQLNAFRKHLFGREYMSGVDREKVRVKATGEVFTPTDLVEEVVFELEMSGLSGLLNKTFLDPSCGDGQFLASVLMRKLEKGYGLDPPGDSLESALRTLYGVDLMQDNVDLCRERLLCGREDLRHIVEKNIVCADALTYHYKFNGEPSLTHHDVLATLIE